MRTIETNKYEIIMHQDSDWGMHKADDGYSIDVDPIYEGEWFSYGAAKEIALRETAKRIGSKVEFVNATELYEFCEDGDPEALRLDEEAEKQVGVLFEKIRLELSEKAIQEIEGSYPERENKEYKKEKIVYIKR